MLVKSILCVPPLQSALVTLPALDAHLISNTYSLCVELELDSPKVFHGTKSETNQLVFFCSLPECFRSPE